MSIHNKLVKTTLTIICVLCILATTIGWFYSSFLHIKNIKINNTNIRVEVADNPQKHAKGLMNRIKLEKNSGMLFVFEKESSQPFWMANTKIPLDIIWIGENKKIVHIQNSAPPCTDKEIFRCPIYTSPTQAKYVLEVNGGFAKENSFNLGDYVQL